MSYRFNVAGLVDGAIVIAVCVTIKTSYPAVRIATVGIAFGIVSGFASIILSFIPPFKIAIEEALTRKYILSSLVGASVVLLISSFLGAFSLNTLQFSAAVYTLSLLIRVVFAATTRGKSIHVPFQKSHTRIRLG